MSVSLLKTHPSFKTYTPVQNPQPNSNLTLKKIITLTLIKKVKKTSRIIYEKKDNFLFNDFAHAGGNGVFCLFDHRVRGGLGA